MNYREDVIRTLAPGQNNLIMGALGLCGESGEVADLIKKSSFHGNRLNKNKVIEELGDVRYYLELMCITLGVSLKEVEALNVTKRKKRYPEGFSTKASIERKDVIEGKGG